MRYAFLLLLVAFGFCKKPATDKNNKQELLKTELRKFFSVPVDAKSPLNGIFRVDKDSLITTTEQKYLNNYKAQPDESSLEVVRGRMKNTTIFYRISAGGAIAMATIAPGSIGVSEGFITKQPKKNQQITWLGKLKNRKGEIQIRIIHPTLTPINNFEYIEGDVTLKASRERRSPDELTSACMETILQNTGLAEY